MVFVEDQGKNSHAHLLLSLASIFYYFIENAETRVHFSLFFEKSSLEVELKTFIIQRLEGNSRRRYFCISVYSFLYMLKSSGRPFCPKLSDYRIIRGYWTDLRNKRYFSKK